MFRLPARQTATVGVAFVAALVGAITTIAPPFLGILLIVASVAVVVLAIPLGVFGAATAGRFSTRAARERGLGWLVVLQAVGSLLVGGAGGVIAGPDVAALVVPTLAAVGVFWHVVPLATGLAFADRWDVRLRHLLFAWPLALLVAIGLLFAPMLVGNTNLLFTDGPARIGGFLLLALAVVFGPALIGAGLTRVRG